MSHRTDPYALLGVPRSATRAQIQAAYRRLARELHPDASQDPGPARQFARVSQASAILGDAARRRAYERGIRGRFAAPGTAGPASFAVEEHAPIYLRSDLGHRTSTRQATR